MAMSEAHWSPGVCVSPTGLALPLPAPCAGCLQRALTELRGRATTLKHARPAAGVRREVVLVTVREERVVVGRGDELVRRVDRHALPVRVVALQADVRQLRLLLVAVVGLGEKSGYLGVGLPPTHEHERAKRAVCLAGEGSGRRLTLHGQGLPLTC